MKLFITAMLVLLLYSCKNNQLKGKIELRGDKYYLVNTATDKAYQFTVKNVASINDTPFNYKTFVVKLAPGEENPIGKSIEVKKTETRPEIKFDEEGLPIPIKDYTIYIDTVVIKNNYQVSGQLELKMDIKYSSQKMNK